MSLPERIDRELVLELQDGSLEARGALFDRYRSAVYRTAVAITGDRQAAKDLLQVIFLQLHRDVRYLDPNQPLIFWLYQRATKHSCGWVRRRQWRRLLEALGAWFMMPNDTAAVRSVEKAEEWRAIERAILALPLAQRTVVVLFYIDDLSVVEIAQILEIPTEAVNFRLQKGRRELEGQIESQSGQLSEVQYEFT